MHIGGIGETTSTSGDEISVDVTDRLPRISHSASLVGEPGLRLMLYRTERSTDALVLGAQDDGKTITCLASVADIGAMSATAKLIVHRELNSFQSHIHTPRDELLLPDVD